MHITTVNVISANGKITKGETDSHSWTSAADWQHFSGLAAGYPVLVMDDATYDTVEPVPEKNRLRMVVTKHPAKYADKAVAGQLEFVNEPPESLVKQLEARGKDRILLVGKQVNAMFLAAKLVDEMFVTIEPVLFGEGRNWLDHQSLDVALRLVSAKRLNERGTLLLHYSVERE